MMHLRHAYGQWKQVGAGQTDSQLVDVDVFHHVLDYWGPNGMLAVGNTQVFWQFYKNGDLNAAVAIENRGTSGDLSLVSDRIELQAVRARFPVTDLTGHCRLGRRPLGLRAMVKLLRLYGLLGKDHTRLISSEVRDCEG